MSELVWTPQKAFADHFLTDASEIIENRSVLPPDIEYHVDYGGRGSAKTWTWADAVAVEASIRPVRILVTREFQNSIEESIKDEIEDAITRRGLDFFFRATRTEIKARNGSKFLFRGIKNNIKSLKSLSNVDIVLCEEAENITRDSWEKLIPSIRPKSGRPPVFIILFNPDNELDDTYQRWVVNPPANSMVKLINWRDNKYFPPHLERQRQHAKKTLPAKDYDHIWEGVPKGSSDNVIIDLAWIKASRFASKREGWRTVGNRAAAYDPAGQGRDYNAVACRDGNVINRVEEWLKSPDLREATRKALLIAQGANADLFRYDECGGFGDGVAVFVDDATHDDGEGNSLHLDKETGLPYPTIHVSEVIPFNAGDTPANPDEEIPGTAKTVGETYTNAKAHNHGVTAQLFYNTYRWVVLGEDVDPKDMISLDIEDDQQFNKLARELSTPTWVKSEGTSKKKVESKKDMEKRTGLASPNMADAVHMLFAPYESHEGIFDAFMAVQEEREREAGESGAEGFADLF